MQKIPAKDGIIMKKLVMLFVPFIIFFSM